MIVVIKGVKVEGNSRANCEKKILDCFRSLLTFFFTCLFLLPFEN